MPGCFSSFKSLLPKRRAVKNQPEKMTTNADEPHQSMHVGIPCSFSYGSENRTWQLGSKEALPPAYSGDSTFSLFNSDAVETIEARINELDKELRELSLKIHDHPELGFKERYAHDTLTEFMSTHGFSVTKHYLDLDTAWRAEFSHGTGGRVLGVNSEMDALPGIGHACGHNLIAIAGVAVALGVKAAMEKHNIDGKVILLGTPAEEGGAGKEILIKRGGYNEMDACLMCHPGPGPKNSTGTGPSLALSGIEVEYFGHTAHASAAPWEGQNALDAAFLAYSAVAVLRQQIKPDHRVHGIVQGKDWAANIIPDYAKMLWYVRAPTGAEVLVLRERVKACFEAAAHATGCRVKLNFHPITYDLRQNSVLIQDYAAFTHHRYGMQVIPDAEGAIGGSTDFGNVTYTVPAIHPMYAIPTIPNGGNHTPGFTASARTPEAHAATLVVAKALAQTGLRVLTDKEFSDKVKDAFKKEVPPREDATE